MRVFHRHRFIVAPFFLVMLSLSVWAQGRRPLSVADIEKLLKAGVSPSRVVELIEETGVNFTNSGAMQERLQEAGADTGVLVAVGKAADKNASTKAAGDQRKPEPTKKAARA